MLVSVDDLLQTELQKLYSIETQMIDALPYLMREAKSEDVRQALSHHLDETKEHAKRLEGIGAEIDMSFEAKDDTQDKGMKGMLEEEKTMLKEVNNPQLKDTIIIGGSEKVEHYEMAAYESAMMLAKQMGMDEVVNTLKETYDEEKKSANLLKGIAEGGVEEVIQKIKVAL